MRRREFIAGIGGTAAWACEGTAAAANSSVRQRLVGRCGTTPRMTTLSWTGKGLLDACTKTHLANVDLVCKHQSLFRTASEQRLGSNAGRCQSVIQSQIRRNESGWGKAIRITKTMTKVWTIYRFASKLTWISQDREGSD
jgi:hypothetical protein